MPGQRRTLSCGTGIREALRCWGWSTVSRDERLEAGLSRLAPAARAEHECHTSVVPNDLHPHGCLILAQVFCSMSGHRQAPSLLQVARPELDECKHAVQGWAWMVQVHLTQRICASGWAPAGPCAGEAPGSCLQPLPPLPGSLAGPR